MTKEEREDRIEEIINYRSLWKEEFDFGEAKGYAKDTWFDNYLLKQELEDLTWYEEPTPKKRGIRNRDFISQQQRLKAQYDRHNYGCNTYYDETKERWVRYYISGRRRYARWCSERAVRHAKNITNGGNYKKVFDMWWTIY